MSFLKRLAWTMGLTMPVYIVSYAYRNPQVLLAYTGGMTGLVILLVMPPLLMIGARKQKVEEKYGERNVYKSLFHHLGWSIFLLVFGAGAFGLTIYGLVVGGAGGG